MWFLPLAGLMAAVVALGLVLGLRSTATTETEIIERIADLYLAEGDKDATRTDCRAVPAQSQGLWLVVICERADGAGREYFVDNFGRVEDQGLLESDS